MHNDKKMFRWLGLLILLPLLLAIFGGDRFRYPCQDPNNWDQPQCKKPVCEVTRTCPEQIFKGNEQLVPAETKKPVIAPALQSGVTCK